MSIDFHTSFENAVNDYILQLEQNPTQSIEENASDFWQDSKDVWVNDLGNIEFDEPPLKKLKSAQGAIESIQDYIKDNAINITYRDEESLKTLADKISQVSPHDKKAEKLYEQIKSIRESLNSEFNLNSLPKVLLTQLAFFLLDNEANNFINSYKFLKQADIFKVSPNTEELYFKSFAHYFDSFNENTKMAKTKSCFELSLDFEGIEKSEELFTKILREYPLRFLKKFTLKNIKLSEKKLTEIFFRLKDIKDISFHNVHLENTKETIISALAKHSKTIEKLDLTDCTIRASKKASDIAKLCDLASLKAFKTSTNLSSTQINLLIRRNLESIRLPTSQWNGLIKSLATSPSGKTTRQLFLNIQGKNRYKAIQVFVQSEYLTNVQKLKISVPSDFSEDDIELNPEAIEALAKSKKLENIETLDIGSFRTLNEIDPERDSSLDPHAPNFVSLLDSPYLKKLKYLVINPESFFPERLLSVFDPEKYPDFKYIKINIKNKQLDAKAIIRSQGELKDFYKFYEDNFSQNKVITTFNQKQQI